MRLSFFSTIPVFIVLIALFVVSVEAAAAPGPHSLLPRLELGNSTHPHVPQGSATDGGGEEHGHGHYTLPSVFWIVFSALVGTPLAVAGVRGWRLTTAAGLGLGLCFPVWVAFVNTMSSAGLSRSASRSDIILTLLVLGAFIVGWIIGFLPMGIRVGMVSTCVSGGFALGIMLAITKHNLLVPIFAINWVIIAALGLIGLITVIFHRRASMIVSTVTVGLFLDALAIDLAINGSRGMSRGLRFLMDRNSSHADEMIKRGYRPPVSTTIILCIAISFIPLVSILQHKLFPGPFERTLEAIEEWRTNPRTPRAHRTNGNRNSTAPSFISYPPPAKTRRFTRILPRAAPVEAMPYNYDPSLENTHGSESQGSVGVDSIVPPYSSTVAVGVSGPAGKEFYGSDEKKGMEHSEPMSEPKKAHLA